MTKIIITKQGQIPYTNVSNFLAKDSRLSWKARGIYLFLWSNSNKWNYYESEVVKHSQKDGISALRSGLKELEKYHYLTRTRVRKNGKYTGVNKWTLYYIPKDSSAYMRLSYIGKPYIRKSYVGKSHPNNYQSDKIINSNNHQSDQTSRIEQELGFDFRYYKNYIHAQQLPIDTKKLAKEFPLDVLKKAIDKTNKYQLTGHYINYPPKYISKVASQLMKKSSSNDDDGFIDNSGVDMMAKAREQTKQALAKLKKEGKIK